MDSQQFGQWLESARKTHGISAEDVAEIVGVTPPAVYNWENGTSVPGKSRFAKMEAAYRLPAGSVAAALSDPLAGGALAYWIGRWEQSAAHLRRVVLEQDELIAEMKRRGSESPEGLVKTVKKSLGDAEAKRLESAAEAPTQSAADG